MAEDLNMVIDAIDNYRNYNPGEWLNNGNPVLIEFIAGAAGFTEDRLTDSRKKTDYG